MDLDYQRGGKHWDAVSRVVQQCGCSQDRAILVLKACSNNVDRAVLSVTGFSTATRRPKPPVAIDGVPEVDTPSSSDGEDAPEIIPSGTPRPPGEENDLEVFTAEVQLPAALLKYALPILAPRNQARIFKPSEGSRRQFSIERLIFGLQSKATSSDVQEYFSYFNGDVVRMSISQEIEKVPSIFYAVSTNNCEIVQLWVNHGGNVNAVDGRYGVPLLVFAILNSLTILDDTTAMVAILLGHGADPRVIPLGLYFPVLRDGSVQIDATPSQIWCNAFFQKQLETTLNLTQRYFLTRSQRYQLSSVRKGQAAEHYKLTSLFRLPFSIIGQTIAIDILTDLLVSYLIVPDNKPLVLMFAGPSGHGKTELGTRLGSLLSLEMQRVDMTEIKYQTDLFGPKVPFVGSEVGSPLNNFLSRMSGKRAIVFLDEVEKTSEEVLNSLLILFDEGKYHDRRNRRDVDCSKIIWILATNSLDHIITQFRGQIEMLANDAVTKQLLASLQSGLKSRFGFPFSGRISSIIPFMTFTAEEQAVVTHMYILHLARRVRKPVQLPNQLVGNVILRVPQESAFCTAVAASHYDPDTGARSLDRAIRLKIGVPLFQSYLAFNQELKDNQPMEEYNVVVDQQGDIHVKRIAN